MTRCLSYARSLNEKMTPFFFSMASAIEIIEEMGYEAEYFVSPSWTVNDPNAWNRELALRLGMMLERVRPSVIIFDGTWPYKGLLTACKAYDSSCPLVWSSRGFHKSSKVGEADISQFDLIVEPGEIAAPVRSEVLKGGLRKIYVPPVCLLQDDELLSKADARRSLGLELNGRYVLFSLGAGNLNDFGDVANRLIQRFDSAGFTVVWARAPITVSDVDLPDGVESISVYPLVRYLRAFDGFVGAAGYNTCCEVVQAGVSSLLVPNVDTALDDQSRRAALVAANALAVVSSCHSEIECDEAVAKLLALHDKGGTYVCKVVMNGAEVVAEKILELLLRGQRT